MKDLHFMEIFSVTKNCLNSPNVGKLGAVRTRGPDGKIRIAGAHEISQSDSRI